MFIDVDKRPVLQHKFVNFKKYQYRYNNTKFLTINT